MNSDNRMREFGDALRVHRRASSLTQVDLAARMTDAGHAWYGSTVSKTESGDRAPGLTELTALARILTLDVADLLGEPVDHREPAAAADAATRMAALRTERAQIKAEQQREHRSAIAAAQARIERLERLARELTALDLGGDPRTSTAPACSPAPPAGAAQRAAHAPGWSR